MLQSTWSAKIDDKLQIFLYFVYLYIRNVLLDETKEKTMQLYNIFFLQQVTFYVHIKTQGRTTQT